MVLAGGTLLWLLGLLWVLGRKGYVPAPEFVGRDVEHEVQTPKAAPSEPEPEVLLIEAEDTETDTGEEPPPRPRRPKPEPVEAVVPEVEPEVPTYPVWFESERSIGVCKVKYGGGSKTANLHVSARFPAGKLSFRYECGKHSGRGIVQVKPKRVNGVLFCSNGGKVTVQIVRSKESRCVRS